MKHHYCAVKFKINKQSPNYLTHFSNKFQTSALRMRKRNSLNKIMSVSENFETSTIHIVKLIIGNHINRKIILVRNNLLLIFLNFM